MNICLDKDLLRQVMHADNKTKKTSVVDALYKYLNGQH